MNSNFCNLSSLNRAWQLWGSPYSYKSSEKQKIYNISPLSGYKSKQFQLLIFFLFSLIKNHSQQLFELLGMVFFKTITWVIIPCSLIIKVVRKILMYLQYYKS